MSIRDKLEALRAGHPVGMPHHDEVRTAAMRDLVAAEEKARPLRPGRAAPTFRLPDAAGDTVALADLLRKGPLVITFYRGLWCPYCRRDIQGFGDALAAFRSRNVSVVAISHRRSSSEALLRETRAIPFPVLDDDTGDVAVRFGIRWSPAEVDVIDDYLRASLVSFRGTEPWIVPMQARFVIGRDGVVAHSEVAFDYGQRREPNDLLTVIGAL